MKSKVRPYLAAVLVLGACQAAPKPAAEPVPPGAPAAEQPELMERVEFTFDDEPMSGEVVRIHLLDAGKGDRVTLRWDGAEGDQLADVQVGWSLEGENADGYVKDHVEVAALLGLSHRTIGTLETWEAGVVDTKVLELSGKGPKWLEGFDQVKGSVFARLTTPRRQVIMDITKGAGDGVTAPAATTGILARVYSAAAVTYPEEAVGAGARWWTRQRIDSVFGPTMEHVEVELTSIDGDDLHFAVMTYEFPTRDDLWEKMSKEPLDELLDGKSTVARAVAEIVVSRSNPLHVSGKYLWQLETDGTSNDKPMPLKMTVTARIQPVSQNDTSASAGS
jgi:hypothetical protein